MANNLFNTLGGNNMLLSQFGNAQNLISQFNQFKNSYNGNPQQQIQQMLNSGKITQDQYNKAVQMATAFQKMLGQ